MPTIEPTHRSASTMVIRSRFFSTTDEPPCCEVKPPPNMSDRPPPLPLCSRTKTINSRLVMPRITSSVTTTDGSSLSNGLLVCPDYPDRPPTSQGGGETAVQP